MKKLIAVTCAAMLCSMTFASARTVAPPEAPTMKASDATDFSARKKMKRMKKGMMRSNSDASKMGGEPPSGSMPGQKKM